MIGPHTSGLLSNVAILVCVTAFSSFAIVSGAKAWVGVLIGVGVTFVLAAMLAIAAWADNRESASTTETKRER